MDPTKGQDQSTKWTNPTRVTNLYNSTKWTDPTKGQDHSPQNGRTQPGSQIYTSQQSGRTPPRVKTSPQNGRTQPGSQTYTNPQSGRTPPRVKTPVHITDGPNQVTKLYKSTKWTATKGHDHIPRNGRTRPVSQTYKSPRRGRTK